MAFLLLTGYYMQVRLVVSQILAICLTRGIQYRHYWLTIFTSTYYIQNLLLLRVRRGRDRMVIRFTTTYAISAYHH